MGAYTELHFNTELKRDLHVRCNLKNYNSEIEKFLDWIKPWVNSGTECLGYYRHEEEDHPTLIYKKGATHDLVALSKILFD